MNVGKTKSLCILFTVNGEHLTLDGCIEIPMEMGGMKMKQINRKIT